MRRIAQAVVSFGRMRPFDNLDTPRLSEVRYVEEAMPDSDAGHMLKELLNLLQARGQTMRRSWDTGKEHSEDTFGRQEEVKMTNIAARFTEMLLQHPEATWVKERFRQSNAIPAHELKSD